MEKLKGLYQTIIHSPKRLFLFGLTVFSIILIIFTATYKQKARVSIPSITPTPTLTSIPTPITSIVTREEPFPTPSLTIRWTAKETDIPPNMEIFTISEPLINPKSADAIAKKLGFSKTEEQDFIDENFRSWSKGDISLSTNFLDNELFFSSGNVSTPQKPKYSEDSYFLAANNYLQNIFGPTFTRSLIKQGVTYHKIQRLETLPASPSEATLVRVSFYQTINGYPLTTTSETGAIVSLFLDKNLGLNSLTVKDAYLDIASLGNFETTPLSELIDKSGSTALRINASPYYDIAIDIATAKNITFNQSSVIPAYFSYNKQLVPVYLLEGTVKTGATTPQLGLYILPATK
ncbi:MAG: hypothetical protein UX08_C0003G0036 [Candidatus Collierbacteria bacterium GW2011_GWB1_45_35]|uniref:Uncharacterized protein n=2 Tax=Candidatus Collieribacteriota TaxID=1752725 RepID=A0A0G1NQN6_9BACT|nr:MAG: hypothetical protein UW48_C0006G0083 [Microgenomates group bacterium GW2011_GWC1_44_23]KKT86524.1 MAG: hypothetical protein UW84_C0010G0007 [Candidatus Collierbacteria bacterium GW2011_GWA2_44_99]KKT96056.1 MAG: hypothetical protein UW96_C0002G0083 [Candidatus Collierbacteria bacterium GW2011_GWA1_45_15]KKU01070.1 MAG: hypothetical protein UX01_C0002G0036 [Candidatus Collierbacteria bacterium GW2011_GWB2_45_17]KKU05680.1 MAG: hypothetical protein UX08_C0003G0036 [Candidatus Collierbacte